MFYLLFLFSYFNPSPTTALYPLSLHDALPISRCSAATNFSAVSDRIICTPPERDADAACQWWGRPSQIPGGPTPDAPVGGPVEGAPTLPHSASERSLVRGGTWLRVSQTDRAWVGGDLSGSGGGTAR